MANYKRLRRNENGDIFTPMNVDSSAYEENFMNSKKIGIAGLTALVNLGLVTYTASAGANAAGMLLLIIVLLIVDQHVLRYQILEEKYFHKMYLKMKRYKKATLSVIWDIRRLKSTEEGTIMEYVSGKVGIIVALSRDTIVGRADDFEEIHYDSVSDFLKSLNTNGLAWIHMNMMETAGKDPRIVELDKIVAKTNK